MTKDSVIIESYLKANMLRVKNAEHTISAIQDITGNTQTVEALEKIFGFKE